MVWLNGMVMNFVEKSTCVLFVGPNFLWHLDGYDKLKQFGFAIHGCIDGFSRFIIWLESASTNNDPKVTGYSKHSSF